VRIEKLKQTFKIDATLIHFPLHPETPMEGRSMAELYAGRNVDPEAMYARMKGLMDTEGLAYFVDARNIGDPDILVELAASVGLPAEEARAVLAERRLKDAVDADWAKSHQYGVTGVPTFVAARYGVVGAQPYEVLEQLLDKAGAKRRA